MPSPADQRLADFLLKHGFLSEADLDAVMRAQVEGRKKGPEKPIADLLIEQKKLDPEAAKAVAEALAAETAPKDPAKKPVIPSLHPCDLVFCMVAKEEGLAKPADLQAAAGVQRRLLQEIKWRRPIGEVLHSLNRIAAADLVDATKVVRERCPKSEPALIEPVITNEIQEARVRLAMDSGTGVTEAQIDTCLKSMAALARIGVTRRPGEIFLLIGALTKEKIDALPSPAGVARAKAKQEGREPRRAAPRIGRPKNAWIGTVVTMLGVFLVVGVGGWIYFMANKQPVIVQNPDKGHAATRPPVNSTTDSPISDADLKASDFVGLLRDADTAFVGHNVYRALAQYDVIARKAPEDLPERPEVEQRKQKSTAMVRAFDLLVIAINGHKNEPFAYTFDNGTEWQLESADREAIALHSAKLDLHTKTPWIKVSPHDLVGIFDSTGTGILEPYGATVFACEYADGRGAAPWVALLAETEQKLVLEWYPHASYVPLEVAHADPAEKKTPEAGEKTSGDNPGTKGTTSEASEADRAALAAKEARVKAAADAETKARALATAGKHAEALEGLKDALDQARGSDQEKSLQAAWDEIAARFVKPLEEFDDPGFSQRWQALNGKADWNGLKDQIHSGAGSVQWTPGDSDLAVLMAVSVPKDWSAYPYLSMWIYAEKKGFQFDMRIATTPEAGWACPQTVDWTGWKHLRIRLDKLRKVGVAEWTNVGGFGFMHAKGAPGGAIFLDELRLEAETVPAALGGEGGGDPAGVGPGGKTPGGGIAPLVTGKGWPRPTQRHYVSLDHGMAIIPPKGWKSIPAPKDMNPGFQQADQVKTVIRFEDRTPDPQNFAITMELSAIAQATSLDDAVKTYLASLRDTLKPTNSAAFKIGPWTGQYFQLAGRFFHNVVVMFSGNRAAAMTFTSGDKYGVKKAEEFKGIARTFLFISDTDLAYMKSKMKGQTNLPAGWSITNTTNYEIQYNCDEEFAKTIGKHLELILKEYKKRFPMDMSLDENSGKISEDVSIRFTVKVFKTFDEFNSYAASNGVGGAAAYFSPMQNELVCYKTVDEGRTKTLHILYHEASHQYLHLYMGRQVDIPIWLNEGVAEYFYGGEFKPNGSFVIEENKERMPVMKESIRTGTFVPLEKIMHYTQAEYYANPQICYAEGWSLAYFLWLTKDEKYKGRLDKFYDVLKSSGDKEAAHAAAFGDLDVPTFEEDWKKFVLGL